MHRSLYEVLRPNIYLLRVVGIWPLPPNSNILTRYFAYLRIFMHIMCCGLFAASLFYTIYLRWGNISILADFGNLMFSNVLLIFKLVYIIMSRQSCRRVLNQLKGFWEISQEAKERRNFEFFAGWASTVTIACVIMGCAEILSTVVPSVVKDIEYRLADNHTNTLRTLPLDISCGFDNQRSPIFEFLLIFQTLTHVCGLTAIAGCDCTAMTFILHLTGQFRLISARLQAIGNEIYHRRFHEFNDNFLAMEIGRIVVHHQRTIRFADELNDLIGPMAFGQIITSGLLVCLSGFSVIKGNNNQDDIIKFIILFVCINVQLLMWCWPGELLIQESKTIAQTVYFELPWFMLPTAIQRDLGLIMLRAQKECKIDQFLQVICMRKLTEVFNTAASYMALLRSIED